MKNACIILDGSSARSDMPIVGLSVLVASTHSGEKSGWSGRKPEYDLSHHPFHDTVSKPASPKQREYEAVYGRIACRFANVLSRADFLYLADLQKGSAGKVYVDSVHYTPDFSGVIARRVFEHMSRRNPLR